MAIITGIGGGNSNIIHGLMASRPNPGIEGRLFIPTDGYYASLDTGENWQPLIKNFKNIIKPPTMSELVYYGNNNDIGIVDDYDGLLMTFNPTTTSPKSCVALMVLPSAPYHFTVGIEIQAVSIRQYPFIGICLAEKGDGTGKFAHWVMKTFNQLDNRCTTPYFSSLTSFYTDNALSYAYYPPWTTGFVFFQIHDDGTNRLYKYSGDNVNFYQYGYKSRSDYFTPSYCGIVIGGSDNIYPDSGMAGRVFHWYLGT